MFYSQRVWIGYNIELSELVCRPFPSSPGPLYQNEVKCSAFDMEMIFHSHANKTHFIQKGCALGLILKVRVFETRRWPIKFTKSSRPTPRRDVRCVWTTCSTPSLGFSCLLESYPDPSGIVWILPKDDQSARKHADARHATHVKSAWENMLLVTSPR